MVGLDIMRIKTTFSLAEENQMESLNINRLNIVTR